MAGRLGEGWDNRKMLDLYIYDYMKKKSMPEAAEILAREANLLPDDLPRADEGLLNDWWSVFCDAYSAKPCSSSVQHGNALQSIHMETPVVANEHGNALQSMTWQQLEAQLQLQTGASSSNSSSQLFQGLRMETQNQAQLPISPAQAHSLKSLLEQELAIPIRQLEQARARARARRAELMASSSNASSQQLQALRMATQTQQQVPPRLGNALQSMHMETPVAFSPQTSTTSGFNDGGSTNSAADNGKEMGSGSNSAQAQLEQAEAQAEAQAQEQAQAQAEAQAEAEAKARARRAPRAEQARARRVEQAHACQAEQITEDAKEMGSGS